MFDSFDILMALKKLDLLKNSSQWWWPNAHSFETILGVILTQNTKWENVEKSLYSLKKNHILGDDNGENLKNIASIERDILASYIVSSGFFNQKSIRLINLCTSILSDFGSFEVFVSSVDREWLLKQKGIGKESADSILNYVCGREVMVVDKYTYKLLLAQGIEIEDYDELQAWFENGIRDNLDEVYASYANRLSLSQIYARFHGKIVELSKRKIKLEL
ncbi:3-methyladenine DNA glycosylase [Helicobacter sp. 13S00477-4]|uniref:3-methyladenine DNA glycosylase n=1 Tax=Helicobacter sp. 13S00477-4 TaxID=1905759 RepID=UPI000BA63DF4|nr:3-methyladenine DNA glycosylase [Helicobacter sp. 13S00477-4]PAF50558.1 3-methyladenine DNA glycosylase [Helicobacter sp. 13S00477-4]